MSNFARRKHRTLLLERLEDRTLPSTTPSVIDLSGLQVNTGSYDSSNILVQFRNAAATPSSLLAGTTIGQQLGLVNGLYEVDLAPGITVDQALAAYRANFGVLSAEPDYQMVVQGSPNDPSFNQQWALSNTGQNGGKAGDDISALQAWSVTTGTRKVTVAVMDSGIDYNHVDLYQNIWVNQAEIPTLPFAPGIIGANGVALTGSRRSNLTDVDGDGLITFADLNNKVNQGLGKITDVNGDGIIDASDILAPMVTTTINGKLYDTGKGGWAYTGNTQDGDTAHPNDFIGWNFVNNTNNPLDDNDHGTHVSGIIGAMGNNGVGVAGVDWQVSLMPVKFISSNGVGSVDSFIAGLAYSLAHGAKISNNSWTGATNSQMLLQAITNARAQGQIFVAAAGNSSTNTDVTPAYPSSFALDNIVSVAAVDSSDNLASFSNYGVKTVSLAAPGVGILSTTPSNTYQTWDGTSMAAPMVTGVLALVWGEHPTWTYQQVIAQVLTTVTPVASLKGKVATGGVVNAAKAVGYTAPAVVVGALAESSVWNGPTANTPNSATVTFNKPMSATTFTGAVTLTGPSGQTIPVTVAVVANSNNTQFNFTFATQSAPGTYTLAFGATVRAVDGTYLKPYQTTFTIPTVLTFSSSVAVPIPDVSKASSTITINQDITIGQMTVTLNINHTYDSDLYIHLTSPSGTDILLSNRRGGSGHNYANTVFSDNAMTPIGSGSAPFTGTFEPEAPLGNLDGEDARGVWHLWVEDRAAGDVGTILNWSLQITAGFPVVTAALGTHTVAPTVIPHSSTEAQIAQFTPSTPALGGLSAALSNPLLTASAPTWQALAPVQGTPVAAPVVDSRVTDQVFSLSESPAQMRETAWATRLSAGDEAEASTPDGVEAAEGWE